MRVADALREEPGSGEQQYLILDLRKLVVEIVTLELLHVRRQSLDDRHPHDGANQRRHGDDDDDRKPAQLGDQQQSACAQLDDFPRIESADGLFHPAGRGIGRLFPREGHQEADCARHERARKGAGKEVHPIDARQLNDQGDGRRGRRPYHAGDEPPAERRAEKLFVVAVAARSGHLVGQRNCRNADQHADERGHDAHQRIISAAGARVTSEHPAQRLAVSSMLHGNPQQRHHDEHDDEVRVLPQRLLPDIERRLRVDQQSDAQGEQQSSDRPCRPG